ncbi:MAG: cysteine--tRNA ligase [Erysipelothrix sp.]|jgi:cysteinyl-tRNA synthetase|nr:cysteine--tRNA ligase [Erysipelothrix sp.]
MRLYNSYTGQIEPFIPIKTNEVSMYVCGPTVYNHAHIGNARPIVVFDTLKNILEECGYQVHFVSNYTDVDDKIIVKAQEMNVSEQTITEEFIQSYEKVRESLNATRPLTVKVTDTMDKIIDYIESMVSQDIAYVNDHDVYFNVSRIHSYGQLSNQKTEDLLSGARIEKNEKKLNPLDFTLWKATKDGIKWPSAFGEGRPGWHSECVVMILEHFKGKIDIHGGGMDLKFPHHENEIAQCLGTHNHNLANFWIHNGMLNIDGEKMSKSLGNVIWAKDYIELFGGNVVRWLLMLAHYRSPLNISQETITQAKSEIDKIITVLKQTKLVFTDVIRCETTMTPLYDTFMQACQDDMNINLAMSIVLEQVKQLNSALRQKELNYNDISNHEATLRRMMKILGISTPYPQLSTEEVSIIRQWQTAKANKDFALADELRNELILRGLL